MQARRWGRIVQISSVVGHQGAVRGHVAYATTKSGQYGITKTLARTGSAYGITVNAVAPGFGANPIDCPRRMETKGSPNCGRIFRWASVSRRTSATACLFLCSEAARHVTGATIDVNGGFYMH